MDINSSHKADSIVAYLLLIEENMGIGVLSALTWDLLVQTGKLQPVLPQWHLQTLPLSLLYPQRMHMAQCTRLLVDDIKAVFTAVV